MTVTHRASDSSILLVPPGFSWVAQDRSGDWWAYNTEPEASGTVWVAPPSTDANMKMIAAGTRNKDWKQTLRKVR